MSEKHFPWAGKTFHRRRGDQHYLLVGASGSGKSTLINLMMDSILRDKDVRALVYDPKQELVPFLLDIGGIGQDGLPRAKVMHPFDIRSCSWNMAADITDAVGARQLAAILVPDTDEGSNAFFSAAVRDLLTAVILAFIECIPNEKAWTFRDILLAMFYPPYLDHLCSFEKTRNAEPFPLLRRLREAYLGASADARTRANIQASINSKLAVYEPVAGAWDRRSIYGGPISLKEWISGPPSILVLGNDESARAAIDPINRALFKRAVELVLAKSELAEPDRLEGNGQIWFFLDEVREAGELDGLGRLLTKGRSKGACVVAGFQDIDGMREVYGTEMANEMCAQFNNTVVLRVNSPETASWASDLFGRRLEVAQSSSSGFNSGQGSSFSIDRSRSEEERPFLYSEAFLYGTNAAAAKAVNGFRKGPDQTTIGKPREEVLEILRFSETERVEWPSKESVSSQLNQVIQSRGFKLKFDADMVSEFVPRPSEHQYLKLWDSSDWRRFGLEGEVVRAFPQKASLQDIINNRKNQLSGKTRGDEGSSRFLPETDLENGLQRMED